MKPILEQIKPSAEIAEKIYVNIKPILEKPNKEKVINNINNKKKKN